VRALDKAIRKAREEIGIQAFWVMGQSFAERLEFKESEPHVLFHKSLMVFGTTSPYLDIHADSHETSFMWYYYPELVNLEIWKTLKPTNLTVKDLQVWKKGGMEARKITPQGYFGDPTSANPEKGRKYMEVYGKIAAAIVEAFLKGRYSPPKALPNI
jgi:creatinine amidohydrolase